MNWTLWTEVGRVVAGLAIVDALMAAPAVAFLCFAFIGGRK
jgi:hypothetical protein